MDEDLWQMALDKIAAAETETRRRLNQIQAQQRAAQFIAKRERDLAAIRDLMRHDR